MTAANPVAHGSKKLNAGMFSSLRLDWRTPKEVYAALNAEFQFDLDPCPHNPSIDGLLEPWCGNIFVNPPYGNEIGKWTRKGKHELASGNAKVIVWLVPARTDTRWFQDDLLPDAQEIRFVRGRLHFDDAEQGAPFPSLIVVCSRKEAPR